MTTTQVEEARRYILIAEGLRFCATGENAQNTITIYETVRQKYGDELLINVKNSVESLEGGVHPDRVAQLWSF